MNPALDTHTQNEYIQMEDVDNVNPVTSNSHLFSLYFNNQTPLPVEILNHDISNTFTLTNEQLYLCGDGLDKTTIPQIFNKIYNEQDMTHKTQENVARRLKILLSSIPYKYFNINSKIILLHPITYPDDFDPESIAYFDSLMEYDGFHDFANTNMPPQTRPDIIRDLYEKSPRTLSFIRLWAANFGLQLYRFFAIHKALNVNPHIAYYDVKDSNGQSTMTEEKRWEDFSETLFGYMMVSYGHAIHGAYILYRRGFVNMVHHFLIQLPTSRSLSSWDTGSYIEEFTTLDQKILKNIKNHSAKRMYELGVKPEYRTPSFKVAYFYLNHPQLNQMGSYPSDYITTSKDVTTPQLKVLPEYPNNTNTNMEQVEEIDSLIDQTNGMNVG